MSSSPFFKCYPSDFLAGIAGLKADEIAVYTVALMLIYDRGGPVVADYEHIGWRCQMRPSSAKKLVERLIERGKLGLYEGRLTNNRAEIELSFRRDLAEISRRNGKRHVAKVDAEANENKDLAKPAGSRQEPVTRSQIPEARTASHVPERVSAPAPAPAREADPARDDVMRARVAIAKAFTDAGHAFPPDTGRVAVWAAQGYAPALIVSVVSSGLSRRPNVSTLAYFDNALKEAHERRVVPAPLPQTSEERAAAIPDTAWDRAVGHYRRSGEWLRIGGSPAPDQAGCLAPEAILEKHGYGPALAAPRTTAA